MTSFLDPDLATPMRLDLPTGHHLRRIGADDLDLDYTAVMGSQPRLWRLFGPSWGWPPADMTREQDREDLGRHADEMTRNESFNFAIMDPEETSLRGCVYIDPPDADGYDAEVLWWVVDAEVDGELDRCLHDAVSTWLATDWPLERPRIVGRDISWDDWRRQA